MKVCGDEMATKDGENLCQRCDENADAGFKAAVARRKRNRENRKARDEAMRSLGLVKVRGAMGGTYWG